MLKNYLVFAIRNLQKRKLFSFINILGLTIGLAACLVILKYIDFETSFDKFQVNASRLYRVTSTESRSNQKDLTYVVSSYGLGPAMVSDVPGIQRYIRIHPMYGGTVMSYEGQGGNVNAFHEDHVLIVDSTFFRSFTYQPIEGNLITSLDDPNSIVITRSIAKKYFGSEDPMGKTITLSGGWIDGNYSVTAVIEDVPGNTSLHFDALIPMHNIFLKDQYVHDDGWSWNNWITYVELSPGVDKESVMQQLPSFAKKVIDIHNTNSKAKTTLNLQPLRDMHLQSGLELDSGTLNKSTIYFFGLIALFILLIAWINYINLSTARAIERSREVGIKKAIGALRSQIAGQFFLESVLVNLAGILLALGLAVILLPVLATIIDKKLHFDFSDIRLWLILLGLLIIGSLASGSYPALVLSSFRFRIAVYPGGENRTFSLRKVLVVFQFAASLVLIAGTFTVYRQISYMQSRNIGMQMDQVLVVKGPYTINYREARQKIRIFKDEVEKLPGVTGAATSAAIPGGGYNWGTGIRKSGTQPEDAKSGSIVWIDPDFINLYQMKLLAGHNFNPEVTSDMQSVIINEASLNAFGLGTARQALDEKVIMGGDTCRVLGVLKNYNWNSLKSEVTPFLFRADTISTADISIHLTGGASLKPTVEKIGKIYKKLIPSEPYQYYFLDDFFNSQYKSENQFNKIFGLFAVLAVLISCLGLWGLASFTTTQKLKEIGIRKALGASAGNIVYLLTSRFLVLIMVASVVALPLSWFSMNSWLNGFAYRIGLRWDLFLVPVVILILIALLTVSVQVVRGAATNPANVLRSE